MMKIGSRSARVAQSLLQAIAQRALRPGDAIDVGDWCRQHRVSRTVVREALAELAGADQITVHLREDRRHIQERDLRLLRETCQVMLNLEMAATDDMLKVAWAHKPDIATLVPERREEVTTEGGLDVSGMKELVKRITRSLQDANISVSLFIDPEDGQVDASRLPGVDMVELNTARFAEARPGGAEAAVEVARLARACARARGLGLAVAAGHGLTLHNLPALVGGVPDIEEYNIGHALIGDSVFLGLEASVARYKAIVVSGGAR
jgi:pyridoxine 5-phosphate synthase